MSYPGGLNPPSNSLGMDVDELAAILRQVQSGQLTLQQQQRQQSQLGQARQIGNIGSGHTSLRTGDDEEDSGLSLVNTNQNFGEFSQPLRRPGRTVQDQSDDPTLSKGALQKQIFAARMLGAPVTLASKIAEQSGVTTPSIKPNLGASRPSGTMRSPDSVGNFNSGITVSGSPSSLIGNQNIQQQRQLAGDRSDPKHTVPGLYSDQQQLTGDSFGRATWATTNTSSIPSDRNTSFGASDFAKQSGRGVLDVGTSHTKLSGPLGFSQDVDLRPRDVDLRSSPIMHPPSSAVIIPSAATGQAITSSFQAQALGQSTPLSISGVQPPQLNTGTFSQGTVGLMTPSNMSGYKPWQKHEGDEARKRKLEDELAKFEMQVGPSKQRRAGIDQNESRQPLGGPVQQSDWSSSGADRGVEEATGSPYQWSTNFVHEDDREEYEEIDVEGWINSLVTYKEPEKDDAELLPKRGSSSERRDKKESSRQDKRRRSSSPVRRRREPEGRRGSSRERNRRGVSADKERSRSPLASRRKSPLRPRSPLRSRRGVASRRSASPRHSEREERHPGRDKLQQSARNDKGGRTPTNERRERSPKHGRVERSPRRERTERSPRRERGAASPRRERAERSPRHERAERRVESDHKVTGRGDSREGSKQRGSSQGNNAGHGRSSTGRDERKRTPSDKKTDQSGNRKADDSLRQDGQKSSEDSKRTEIHPKDGKPHQQPAIHSRSPNGGKATEEKKKIQINLAFKKGKDIPKSREDSSSAQAAGDRNRSQPNQSQSKQKPDSTKPPSLLSLHVKPSDHSKYSHRVSQHLNDKTRSSLKKEETMTMNEMAEIVGDSSIKHQISLFTKLDMSEFIVNKQLVEWFCYLCQMPCNSVEAYLTHVVGQKHKSNIAKAFTRAGKPLFVKYLQTLPDEDKEVIKSAQTSNRPKSATTKEANPVTQMCHQCFQTYPAGRGRDHDRSAQHKHLIKTLPRCEDCDIRFPDKKRLTKHYESSLHKTNAKGKQQDKDQDEDDDVVLMDTAEEEGTSERGMELIIPVYGYFCRACTKFYNTDKVTREEHSVDPDHLQKVKNYYNRVKTSTDELQPVQSLDDDNETYDKGKQVGKKEEKAEPKQATSVTEDETKKINDKKEIPKEDVKRQRTKGPEGSDDKKDVDKISKDANENGAKIQPMQGKSKDSAPGKGDGDKPKELPLEKKTVIPSPNLEKKTVIPSPNLEKKTVIPSPNLEKKTAIPSPNLDSTRESANKPKDVAEVPAAVPEADDGKCARSRVYLRKTKKIITEVASIPATNTKSVSSNTQLQIQGKGVVTKSESTKPKSDGTARGKENVMKKGDAKMEVQEIPDKAQSVQVKTVNKGDGSKTKKDGTVTEEKPNLDKNDDKADNSKDEHSHPPNVTETKTKSAERDSKSELSDKKVPEEKKENSKKGSIQENSLERQSRSSTYSSRGRSETSRDSKTDGRPSSVDKDRSSSQSKDDASKKDSSSMSSNTDKEKPRSTPTRHTRSTRESERKDRQEKERERSSSRGKDATSKSNREGTERKRTPQRSSSRSERYGDSSRTRADSSGRSGSSRERETRSSRREQSKSSRSKESNIPNMDDMVAIDEVGSNSGDEQSADMVAIDEVTGSDEEGTVDDKAMAAMMGNMGMDWQVVSELEEEDTSQTSVAPKQIWIIGDDNVHWAADHALDKHGVHLGLDGLNYEVSWKGIKGAKLDQASDLLNKFLSEAKSGPPDTIIFHLGVNDLLSTSSKGMHQNVVTLLQLCKKVIPNTTIIWSSIIPLRFFKGVKQQQQMPLKMMITDINRNAQNLTRTAGGKIITHEDISAHAMFCNDTDLSRLGLDTFINDLKDALEYFHEYPAEKEFPPKA